MNIKEVVNNSLFKCDKKSYHKNDCPWRSRFIKKGLEERWVEGNAKPTIENVCIGGCNECKASESNEFFQLSHEILDLNKVPHRRN